LAKTEPTNKSRRIHDVLGVDFGSTSTKLVRIRKTASGYHLVDADVMPPFDLRAGESPSRLAVPKKLCAPYAAACLTGTTDHVRFMFVSNKMQDTKSIQNRVAKSLGLGNDYRIGFSIVERGREGTDHKVLAAAMPQAEVQSVRKLFSSGKPSLISLEIAGLAALNSFSPTEAVQSAEGAVCYLEAGAEATMISFYVGGNLRLVRKFDYGSVYIQQRIQDVLSVQEDLALDILFEDATPLFEQALDPIGSLLQELSISKKFIERNENTQITAVYASGGLSYSPYWTFIMSQVMGVEIGVWNPFDANGMKTTPKGVQGVESMFAPAVGAALALLCQS
jgi:Tfp pilus assembly PilM family ATPase